VTALGLLELFDQSDRRTVVEKQRRSLEAARFADTEGYARVLVAEHHARLSPSASPIQWATVLAARTERVRVGTGVSLLRLHDTYLTAVEYAALIAVAGDRVDAGLGRGDFRGPGGHRFNPYRKDDAELESAFAELRHLLLDGSESMPPVDDPPQFWLHGASTGSAAAAVRLGMRYCFGLFFQDDLDVAASALRYAADHHTPTALAVSVVANRVPAEAHRDAAGVRDVALNVVGGLDECAETVHRLVELTGADEVILGELSSDTDDHLAAISAIGKAIA